MMWMAWVAVLLQLSSLAIAAPSPDDGRMRTLEAAVAELTRSQQVFQNTMLQKMEALTGGKDTICIVREHQTD